MEGWIGFEEKESAINFYPFFGPCMSRCLRWSSGFRLADGELICRQFWNVCVVDLICPVCCVLLFVGAPCCLVGISCPVFYSVHAGVACLTA